MEHISEKAMVTLPATEYYMMAEKLRGAQRIKVQMESMYRVSDTAVNNYGIVERTSAMLPFGKDLAIKLAKELAQREGHMDLLYAGDAHNVSLKDMTFVKYFWSDEDSINLLEPDVCDEFLDAWAAARDRAETSVVAETTP